jgi:glycosyltransferase involved in cell wall biosynthesis
VVSYEPAHISGVKVITLPTVMPFRRLNVVAAAVLAQSVLKRCAPEIVHAHYVTSYGLAGALLGRYRPLIVSAWGSDVFTAPRQSYAYKALVRFVLARADVVTSVAPHMTEYLWQTGLADREKIVTIPFGTDTTVFNGSGRQEAMKSSGPIVISTRRLDRGMDVELLIRAARDVVSAHPEVRFEIVGDGTEQRHLKRMTAELGLADRVAFAGSLAPEAIADKLSRSDIFVSTPPSDGNNVSLNEAMACGTFPVVSDIDANRAWIQDQVNGLTFRPGDADSLASALIRAVESPERWSQARPVNWNIVQTRASWQHSTRAMQQLYEGVLFKKGSIAHPAPDALTELH